MAGAGHFPRSLAHDSKHSTNAVFQVKPSGRGDACAQTLTAPSVAALQAPGRTHPPPSLHALVLALVWPSHPAPDPVTLLQTRYSATEQTPNAISLGIA